MEKAGWVDGEDLHYEEVEGAAHTESAWAARFDRVLEFLYGPQSTVERAAAALSSRLSAISAVG